jgi:acyl-CoA reductase-like NAD-dependent aldehyde dehydrogenase
MIDDIDIPDELAGSYKRVSRRIPVDLKKDEDLIGTIIAYLKLGGEKLARQAVEAAKQTFELEMAKRKKKAREEALIRAAEARLAARDEENGEAGDDFDDDDDDDDDDMKDY